MFVSRKELKMNSELLKKPVVVGVAALVLGLILGLFWAWQIQPVEWYDMPVSLLRQELQEDYLRMTIETFGTNRDADLAVKRYTELGAGGAALLEKVRANPGKLDPNAPVAFKDMLKSKNVIVEGVTEQPASGGSFWPFVFILLALLLVAAVAFAAFYLLRGGGRRGEITPAQHAADMTRSVEKTDYVARGEAPPVAQYVTTYVSGDDLFDDSFSIDSPAGEFLGECGVGISETIGVGDPKKVTAFEVWMFDKNDIQTVTKVLMSPHAFTDPSFRAKLEAKGELLNVGAQRTVVLETQTLSMTATISDMQLGQGALPDGSYFDRITLELAIWSKKAA
jgi:hypothetical protein